MNDDMTEAASRLRRLDHRIVFYGYEKAMEMYEQEVSDRWPNRNLRLVDCETDRVEQEED